MTRRPPKIPRSKLVHSRIPKAVVRVNEVGEYSLVDGRRAYVQEFGPIRDALDKFNWLLGQAFSNGKTLVPVPIKIAQAVWLHVGDGRAQGRKPLGDLTSLMEEARRYNKQLKRDRPDFSAQKCAELTAEKYRPRSGIASNAQFIKRMRNRRTW